MASRVPDESLFQAKQPDRCTKWSAWEWTHEYSMYCRSRENAEGKVEWQYGNGPPPTASIRQPSTTTQLYPQGLGGQQPRYSTPEFQVPGRSGMTSNLPSVQAFGGRFPGYPYSIPSTTPLPSSAAIGSLSRSSNSYTMNPTPNYQAPQVPSSGYFPGSYQNRPANQTWTDNGYSGKEMDSSLAGLTISNNSDQNSQDYYLQKSSDNYTSRSLPMGADYTEGSRSYPSILQRQEPTSRQSPQSLLRVNLKEGGYQSSSLAKELDNTPITSSDNWQSNKAYPTTLTDLEDDYGPEDDDFLSTEVPQQRDRRPESKKSSTFEKSRYSKSQTTAKASSESSWKKISQGSSKSTSKVNASEKRQSPIEPSPRNVTTKAPRTGSDKLDERFYVQPSKEFTEFRVFMTPWSEPRGYDSKNEQTFDSTEEGSLITVAKYGEKAYHSIRRFVIVVAKDGHSLCLPILTYGGRGAMKSGVKQGEHAIVYTGDQPPAKLQGEENMYKKPVRMIQETARDKLDPLSRINYSKIYTVEHNVKVCFIGHIDPDSEGILVADYERSVNPPRLVRPPGRRQKSGTKSSEKEQGERRKSGK